MLSSKLAAVVLVILPLVAGCAAPEGEGEESNQAASDGSAITLANWLMHPTIASANMLASSADASASRATTNATSKLCTGFGDQTVTWFSSGDNVAKTVAVADLGDLSVDTTTYYAKGVANEEQPFHQVPRYVRRIAKEIVRGGSHEQRAYFDDRGERVFEITRDVAADGSTGAWKVIASRPTVIGAPSTYPEIDWMNYQKYGAWKLQPECMSADEATRRIRDAGGRP